MKKITIIYILLCCTLCSIAQTRFIKAGKIEFERKINVQRQYDPSEDESDWFKEFLSKQPKFHTTYFDLYFNESRSVYQPGRETDDVKRNIWLLGPAKDNKVWKDLEHEQTRNLKNIFEETFLLTDSSRRINWKISDETRDIAGFECRKAVGIICDSVYVVAFYTDEIIASGGPESFSGLPGMILGIAIPRLYTTWYATKLELVDPTPQQLDLNAKGKKVTRKELEATLQKSLKNWGKQAQRNIWWTML